VQVGGGDLAQFIRRWGSRLLVVSPLLLPQSLIESALPQPPPESAARTVPASRVQPSADDEVSSADAM
jgi:hypothetical protein